MGGKAIYRGDDHLPYYYVTYMNMEIKYPLNGKYRVGSRMNSINDAAALNYFHAVSVNKSCQQ